jgi:hypothetical protein
LAKKATLESSTTLHQRTRLNPNHRKVHFDALFMLQASPARLIVTNYVLDLNAVSRSVLIPLSLDGALLRVTFSEWATLAQDRAGWLKLVTKAPFSIGKPQLRPPRCDTKVTPEEKRSFLARRAQETEQRRALFNAETDAETT